MQVCIVNIKQNPLTYAYADVHVMDKENVYLIYDTFSCKVIHLELLENDGVPILNIKDCSSALLYTSTGPIKYPHCIVFISEIKYAIYAFYIYGKHIKCT